MSDLRLVLARHGQTQANIDRILDTVLPGSPLTELGREQARALGRELAHGVDGTVAGLYHSPARRARETAHLVAEHLGLDPVEVGGVHEVQVGELEGRNDEPAIREFRRVYDRWQDGDLHVAQPGGESGHELLARYLPVVADLRDRHVDGGTIVLVSHGAALRLVAQQLVEHVGTPRGEEEHVANCGRVVVRPRGSGWDLVAWRSAVPGGLPATDDPTG
ncbi:histidine phosphatase family protein [Actinomycetospora cinnamomea]|uniref:Putative phosphoglycerate mutase n=1 Tax=Actinomycetospora cinnamomea TaxID=663609 RepID=A0A2U1FBM6_9PSEU|nr:histidine phosphatase family protein [Actinomycetospora cinnamomea]PVZ09595.1 putative phosphoglycerate mutase [Actinomycetospora cinnamomea]